MTHASMPLRQPPLLVGRDRELALLRMRLTEMLKGSGRLILVGGEAGIGKTTLVRSLTDEALRQGALALSVGL